MTSCEHRDEELLNQVLLANHNLPQLRVCALEVRVVSGRWVGHRETLL